MDDAIPNMGGFEASVIAAISKEDSRSSVDSVDSAFSVEALGLGRHDEQEITIVEPTPPIHLTNPPNILFASGKLRRRDTDEGVADSVASTSASDTSFESAVSLGMGGHDAESLVGTNGGESDGGEIQTTGTGTIKGKGKEVEGSVSGGSEASAASSVTVLARDMNGKPEGGSAE